MCSQLIKDSPLDGPINGMVNDAAHGWWKESNSLLMVTSTYCPQLHCWVPSVMSYTNGASTEHFAQHFVAVFQSIALEVKRRKRTLVDSDFAGVMDFSQAEHAGFISAFITFWSTHPDDSRTRQELQIAAERLLKGCREHFRAQVSRVARIAGVVPPFEKESFTKRALALLDAPTSDLFLSHAALLESMHWKLYSACGRNHAFLEGMYSLHAVAIYYEQLFLASLEGTPIRYGDAEPWKVIASHLGRTKKTRGEPADSKKRKRNDGRPPDTAKELLPKRPRNDGTKRRDASKSKEAKPTKHPVPILLSHPLLYPWNQNSCWLDSSLQLLYVCLSKDWGVVDIIIDGLSKDSAIKLVLEHFKYRQRLSLSERSGAYSMEQDRNKIRTLLRKRKIIGPIGEHEPLLSWFHQLLRLEDKASTFRSISAFEIHSVNIHTCSGNHSTGGTHIQISKQQHRGHVHQLTCEDHATYSGDFESYFSSLLSLNHAPITHSACWRVKDGASLCSGTHTSTGKLVVSMPLIYTFDIAPDEDNNLSSWKFPTTLPLVDDDPGLVYELLGFGLISDSHNHFTAQYYTKPEFIQLQARDRTWLHNPFKANTLEYVQYNLNSATTSNRESLADDMDIQEDHSSPRAPSIAPSNCSLPLSSFSLDCLCGVNGDGNLHYNPMIHGPAIQCDECKGWSHIAYQRNGRASNLTPKESFICDSLRFLCCCNLRFSWLINIHRKIEARTGYKAPLASRLKAGRGALARFGTYFYPVRLVQKLDSGWIVRWWRGNEYSPDVLHQAVEISFVLLTDLHDALWRDRFTRRKIRLGKWKHACDVPTSEDILSDPTSVPYTPLTHEILSPFKDVLMKLTLNSFSIKSNDVPAKRWLESKNQSLTDSPVPFVGHLSLVERAQISNWFDQHITAGDPKLRLSWLARLPIAHAFTIYIAHSIQSANSTISPQQRITELMDRAWDIQMSSMPSRSIDTDVDRACLHRLEEDMFEVSSRAEMAGYYQWGLDAGHHQDDWDPYSGLPDSWNLGDHPFDEDLLQVGLINIWS
ncbi:hypothetical protein BJ165DRAFT_1358700 [Panaeolus papilionaceus]|nr:hypothetical protein BJ165DRAFT_1358700 [Panaeolus papilionaceus]